MLETALLHAIDARVWVDIKVSDMVIFQSMYVDIDQRLEVQRRGVEGAQSKYHLGRVLWPMGVDHWTKAFAMTELDGLESWEFLKIIGYERPCLPGNGLCVPIRHAFIDSDGIVDVGISHGRRFLQSSTAYQ